jgi:hypothetical protein
MAAVKPRVKVPKSASAGEVITIKTLISHPMESGQRKDKEGNAYPASRSSIQVHLRVQRADGVHLRYRAGRFPRIPYLEFTGKGRWKRERSSSAGWTMTAPSTPTKKEDRAQVRRALPACRRAGRITDGREELTLRETSEYLVTADRRDRDDPERNAQCIGFRRRACPTKSSSSMAKSK